jgi:hypothetical protein
MSSIHTPLVPIKPVIMPHFLVLIVLEPGLELLQQTLRVVDVLHPQHAALPLPQTKIHLRPSEHRDTRDLSVSHWTYTCQKRSK